MSKCFLHYQLEQRAYLADIRSEPAEAERLRNEIAAHVTKCATCQGIEAPPLVEQLFKTTVIIRKAG